jgi:hypothetical protein
MGPLRARRHALRHASSSEYIRQARSVAIFTSDERDQSESRHEPEAFGTRSVPADPYTAWLERRQADREREDPVRWVMRPRSLAGTAIRASAVAGQQTINCRDVRDRASSARLSTV